MGEARISLCLWRERRPWVSKAENGKRRAEFARLGLWFGLPRQVLRLRSLIVRVWGVLEVELVEFGLEELFVG